MANYYASCRTNYFKVKDPEAFKAVMDLVPGIEVHQQEDVFCLLGNNDDGGGWPSAYHPSDDPDADLVELDLPTLVATHLADDQVAVFLEVGAEKLRYLVGYALAINNAGETRVVSIDDIYAKAGELTSRPEQISVAEY